MFMVSMVHYDKIIQFATYDAASGIMTVTQTNHGMITGNRVTSREIY